MVSLSIPLRNMLTSDLVVYVESTNSNTETPSFLMKPSKIPSENFDGTKTSKPELVFILTFQFIDQRFIRTLINEATLNVQIDENSTECGKLSVLSIGVEFSPGRTGEYQ